MTERFTNLSLFSAAPLTIEEIARATGAAILAPSPAIYVITFNTRDYPGRAVLRRHVWKGLDLVADFPPLAVGASVEAVRAFLPPRLEQLRLSPQDDPVIAEAWSGP